MKYINLNYNIGDKFNINTKEAKILRAFTDLNTEEPGKMTGWLNVNKIITDEEKEKIKTIAKEVREKAKVLVVIGIGGSFLGAKAAIDFLSDYYKNEEDFEVVYVGNNLSEKYLSDTKRYIEDKEFYINVISKSGGTLEPAIAFRYFKDLCEKKYGDKSKDRIIATTSKNHGALKKIADEKGYRTLVIPENVGGRYSVLTSCGLFPIACAGFDIDKILKGAIETKEELVTNIFENNIAFQYAAIRNILYMQGKDIEVYSSFNPNMRFFLEWMKQLFGESECKQKTGIFPASLVLSTDLHSMGQLMQDGKRNVFETFINAENENIKEKVKLQKDDKNYDDLNYTLKYSINEINKIARTATEKAHEQGNVPVIDITFEKQNEETLGALFYFFEFSCAISAYAFSVNPFDQPGVEQYKKNIKELLNN